MTEKNRTSPNHENREPNEVEAKQESVSQAPAELDSEFKITVRKLEMPVKPRGVLAE